MTIHKALYPRDEVDRLYTSRREGGRGLAGIEDSVDVSIQRLEDYLQKRGRRLIIATKNNDNETRTSWTTITRNQKQEEKQLYRPFKRLKSDISPEKTWMLLKKGNLKRETESLPTATQNNAIRTNHIKATMNKTQQNSRCRLCGETIDHIISECCKLAQKEYKTRHDCVGKVIHWELCKKLKFDHTNKWYMHNLETVLENETHKLFLDFDIQTDYLISARRPDLIIINKKERTCKIVDFAIPTVHKVKLKECEKRDKYLALARELKKTVEYESDDYTHCNWCSWYSHQKIGTRTGGLGNNRTGADCPNYSIVEIDQNAE